jgi:SepF-like predicted cell division protein (DUF552 family)
MALEKLKKGFSKLMSKETPEEEYVEIDLSSKEEKRNKILIKLFTLKKYDDINDVLNVLREGYAIVVIDIKTLRSKDVLELKRAVSKLKKTVDALEGNIAGFGENMIIASPAFAMIEKEEKEIKEPKKEGYY